MTWHLGDEVEWRTNVKHRGMIVGFEGSHVVVNTNTISTNKSLWMRVRIPWGKLTRIVPKPSLFDQESNIVDVGSL